MVSRYVKDGEREMISCHWKTEVKVNCWLLEARLTSCRISLVWMDNKNIWQCVGRGGGECDQLMK